MVQVQIVGGDDPVDGGGALRVRDMLARARGPVEIGRPVVGARERRRGAFEEDRRVLVAIVPERPPTGPPRSPLRVRASREFRVQLAEHGVRLLALVRLEVVRGQTVERLFGPGAVRKLLDQRARQCDVFVARAQPARGREKVEARLVSSGPGVEERREAFPRLAVSPQEVVALGQSNRDALGIVAGDERFERLECLPGRLVPLGGEQPFCAAQFERDALRGPLRGEDVLETDQLGGRRGGEVARRKFVVEPRERLSRARSIAGLLVGLSKRQEDRIGRGRLQRANSS